MPSTPTPITPAPVSAEEARRRHIRRGDFVACSDAFIDCRLPGSSPKHNYSFIGPGVTQNDEQFINLREPHGFQVGAAGLPPGVTNNLHLHFTSETFISAGHFRLRWGAAGDEGELDLRPGDVACMPTWMFRGFSNIGSDYGLIFAVLGGDDTGGILWSPEVIQRARATGLFLGRHNQLIDTVDDHGRLGPRPPDAELLPLMPAHEVAALRRRSAAELRHRCLRLAERDFRPATLDTALPGHGWQVAPAVGFGISQHRDHLPALMEPQGFSIDWLRVEPGEASASFATAEAGVVLLMSGALDVELNLGADVCAVSLGEMDLFSIPAGAWRRFVNRGDTPAEAVLILNGDGPKQARFEPALIARALAADVALDAGGHLARASLLPPKEAP